MIRCLYVDDDTFLLEVAKEFLEIEGDIKVEIVCSANDAIKMMSGNTYDAIISDYQMPDMDGINFLKQVRGSEDDVPFILFTGRGREEVVIEALKNGADHYIKKGGDPLSQYAELANLVRQTVRRKEAEESIRFNASRFRALIDNTRDLVTIIDWSGYIVYSSPSTRKTLGYTTEEFKGSSIFSYLHPDDRHIENILMHSAQKDRCGLPAEFRLRAKDGTYRWFQGSASGYLEEKNIGQVILYAWFIDERKSLELELIAKDQAYENLIEQIDEMVFRLDEIGRFISINQAVCRFLGRTRGELIGAHATDIASSEGQNAMFSVIREKLGGQHAKSRHEHSVINALEEKVMIEVTSWVIISKGLKGILGVAVPMNKTTE